MSITDVSGVLQASTAQTTAQTFTEIETLVNKGIMVFVNVTAASGTGGLTVKISGQDPATQLWFQLNADPTAITATGKYAYAVYPAATASGGGTNEALRQTTSCPLPSQVQVSVAVGDASSYTYSVGYELLV